MAIFDTSPEVRDLQLQILRSMSGEERVLLAFEMSTFVRELMTEGIQRDHPDWDESQTAREVLKRVFLPAPLPSWLR